MAVEQILEIGTVRRTVSGGSPDPADRAAFEAVSGVALIEVLGARELWVKGSFSGAATDTATVRLYFYDGGGAFIGVSEALALAATDRTDGGRFLTELLLAINPGAHSCRLSVPTLTTAGNLQLHLGIVP